MASSFKQEMPPPGGFDPVDYAKRFQKPLNGFKVLGGLAAVTSVSWYLYTLKRRQVLTRTVEMNDARIAVSPLFMAESHRDFLKQVRTNREEENEIMKDVEGWETGKINGEPVFYNIRDRFPPFSADEYYAHVSKKDTRRRVLWRLYND